MMLTEIGTKFKTNYYKEKAYKEINLAIRVKTQLTRRRVEDMKQAREEGDDRKFKDNELEANILYDTIIRLLDLGAKVRMAKTFTVDDYIAVCKSIYM